MKLQELFSYRLQLLDESKDAEGYISDAGFLENCLSGLNETKYIDTTDVTDIYCMLDNGAIKINAYTLNESEERLQVFIVNEDSLEPDASEESLIISQKAAYEKQFDRIITFIKKAIRRQFDNQLQDGSPAWVLVRQLASPEFIHQIDVIEVFLVSATVTIQRSVTDVTSEVLNFEDESITVNFIREKERHSKELIIMKRLIDMNFLYNIHATEESWEPLTVNFAGPPYHNPLPCLHAANEVAFDSYLCVLPATLLSELYKRYSSRLLEKKCTLFSSAQRSQQKHTGNHSPGA